MMLSPGTARPSSVTLAIEIWTEAWSLAFMIRLVALHFLGMYLLLDQSLFSSVVVRSHLQVDDLALFKQFKLAIIVN